MRALDVTIACRPSRVGQPSPEVAVSGAWVAGAVTPSESAAAADRDAIRWVREDRAAEGIPWLDSRSTKCRALRLRRPANRSRDRSRDLGRRAVEHAGSFEQVALHEVEAQVTAVLEQPRVLDELGDEQRAV